MKKLTITNSVRDLYGENDEALLKVMKEEPGNEVTHTMVIGTRYYENVDCLQID